MTAKPTARIYRGTPRNLAFLANRLRAGELVAVPTETVYGLAASALDGAACGKIFRAKGRPSTDPLIVHLLSIRQLAEVAEPNEAALKLARAFWPGPLTIILPKRAVVPDIVSAGLPCVAVRVPRHPLFRRLLRLAGIPLAAPSANLFGYISPTTAGHVRAGLGQKIQYILDGGPSSIGVESTIVDVRDPAKPQLLRPGAITRAGLERVLGVTVSTRNRSDDRRAQLAPGLLKRHYSPRTPSSLHPRLTPALVRQGNRKHAWIFIAKPAGLVGRNIFWLDDRGELRGAARRLFDILRRADTGGFTHIHLERASGDGLADAINDRLQRAASR